MPGQIVFKKGRYGNTEVSKDLAVKVHKKIPPPPPTAEGAKDKYARRS